MLHNISTANLATTRDTIETRASGEEQCKDLFELKQLHNTISNNAAVPSAFCEEYHGN